MAEIARHFTLITLDGVKDLLTRRVAFDCRYDFLGVASDGIPKYHCIYLYDGQEAMLVLSRLGKLGPAAREFNLWPGLFKHHKEFGGGSALCINNDWEINCIPRGTE
jgi:hypothetical protein